MELTFDHLSALLSFVAIPLHGLMLRALLKCKQHFSPGFYYIIMHLCVCHLIGSFLCLIIPIGNFPTVRKFLTVHTTVDWIYGLVTSVRGTLAKWTMQVFLALIAINRAIAVGSPMNYHKMCFMIWAIFIIIRLPVIYPFNLQPYHPVDAPEITIYTIFTYQFIYIWVGLFVGFSSLLITYFSYGYIIIMVFKMHVFGNMSIKPSIRRSVIVAFISSIGLFLMNVVELGEEIVWRVWQVDFVPTTIYYFLVNSGYEWSVFSLPISIIIMFPEAVKIGKSRRVVLRQGGGEAGSPRNTVDVQVLRDGDGSRRNTIDLQFKEGRSRKNTLELKVNGEVVASQNEPSDPSMPNSPRTLSIVRSNNGSRPNTPTIENQRNNQVDNSARWRAFNPPRQFYILKGLFIAMCFVDIIHWAYLLRDDSQQNPNSWRFYKRFESFDLYYLVARMFADIFTCVLGLGAAMWTRKPLLTLPCTTIQLLFLIIRAVVWAARSMNRGLEAVEATNEDKIFVICEFAIPLIWVLLSILIVRTTKRLRSYEQLHGYAHPPIIVLTVKNDDNDESVQIEIA